MEDKIHLTRSEAFWLIWELMEAEATFKQYGLLTGVESLEALIEMLEEKLAEE